MKIISLSVQNYRNLEDFEVSLDENCNFLVGDNNLGKSNFLSLLNTLFTYRSFKVDDFKDDSKPITVHLRIKLAEVEIGHFADNFDIDDTSIVSIVAKQENSDENIEFAHDETGTYISQSDIRCVNFVHYDSLRSPLVELNFDKGKGVGKFLRNIISQYLVDNKINDADFLDEKKTVNLLKSVNKTISKVKAFTDFGISALPDNDAENLLAKIVVLKTSEGDSLKKAGHGIQCLILVTLSILDKLQLIYRQRSGRGIFENEIDNTKAISLVLGMDEPEIHLHPYMQRSLIKYINSIVSNNNDDFKDLVNELFDLDEFIGQVIIATHSPNIILNDYRQIVRFYTENEKIRAVSGTNVALPEKVEKHLFMNFPVIKETFFSKCVVIVEGDTECASFPFFAEKLGISFDDLGIAVIQGRGDGGLEPLFDLSAAFSIPSTAVRDQDDHISGPTRSNFFQTRRRDFEEELVGSMDQSRRDLLEQIMNDHDGNLSKKLAQNSLNKCISKYGLTIPNFSADCRLADIPDNQIEMLRCFFLTWLSRHKGFTLGAIIGKSISKELIPLVFKKVIIHSKTLAKDG